MVHVLPPVNRGPSLGQRLAGGFGQALNTAQQLMQEKEKKTKALQALKSLNLNENILNLPETAQTAYFKQAFEGPETAKPLNELQKAQKALSEQKARYYDEQQNLFQQLIGGGEVPGIGVEETKQLPDYIRKPEIEAEPSLQPQAKPKDITAYPENKLRQLAAFAGQPGQLGVMGTMAKNELEQRGITEKARSKKEQAYFNMNEPKLEKIADTERKLDIENARYGRLGELFSDPSKFPSTITAALFTKEGQINDYAYSQLSPEAQESVKLIIDSTSNIKDTYGARVTNFDLQTYLRKLPSLLNSHEGRQRVLRDLQDLNQINQIYNRGIQDVFNKAGGSDKMPWSEAENKFKKEYGPQLKRMLEDFAHPKQSKFKDRPDPKRFMGKKIKDDETGEIFISDGNQWKPFEG